MVLRLIVFVAFLATTCGYRIDSLIEQPPSDAGLNVKQIIEKHNYPFENHTVITEDGYILEVHRIPYGKGQTQDANRIPVLLFPGLFCGSAEWVNMGPKNGLGFILADQGYDVWLANYRGTTWSRKHVTLDPDTQADKFFKYSFHEIGYYDTPAIVDHILAVTEQESLFYIGHSQGTTSYFIFSSTRPEYNSKIRLAITLAPVAYVDHIKSVPIKLFSKDRDRVEGLAVLNGLYEVMAYNPRVSLARIKHCRDGSPLQELCVSIAEGSYGPDQLNKTMLPVIMSNLPAGASIYQLLHFAQLIDSGTFRQYDHGSAENLRLYGQKTPPDYDLSKISSPLALYYGKLDALTEELDVFRLSIKVPNLISMKRIKRFSHSDFMRGKDVVELVYNQLVELMELFQ